MLIPFLKNNNFLKFSKFLDRGVKRERPYKNASLIPGKLLRKYDLGLIPNPT